MAAELTNSQVQEIADAAKKFADTNVELLLQMAEHVKKAELSDDYDTEFKRFGTKVEEGINSVLTVAQTAGEGSEALKLELDKISNTVIEAKAVEAETSSIKQTFGGVL